jgi:pimeloyl-ACP methyl ester carboxylesterase
MLTGHDIPWAVIRLAGVLIAVGCFLFLLISYGLTFNLLRPLRMRGGKALYFLHRLSPKDLDLPYESLSFSVRDHRTGKMLRIAAWWIECGKSTDRCVVILHGYADSKIGGIAWAPLLRELGFNVLAVDLRAHGESEGKFTTAGFIERYDICQILDQLKSTRPTQARQIAIFGVSLGAAVSAATAVLRNDLAAVVLESPYVDFPRAVLSHARNLPVPGRSFQLMVLWLCRRLLKIDFSAVRPVDLIPKIPSPLYVIQSEDDPFVPPTDQAAIAAAVAARPAKPGFSEFWRVPCFHVMSMADQPDEFRRRLANFLESAMAAPQPAKETVQP